MRLLICALLLAAAARSAEPAEELTQSVRSLTSTLQVLEERLADPVNVTEALYQGALPAMVRTLDPHSAFLDPQQFEALAEMQRSTEKGFGSIVSLTPGRVVVLQTLAESPSAKAGLSPGDEIVAMNGYQLAQLSIEQLVGLLTEARQHSVQLMVKRPNFVRLIPMTLVPEELADPSVQGKFHITPDVAYIKIANFEAATDRELHQAIENLGGHRLKGLVLDLRDNPGGVIEAAVRAAALFLEPDQRILWIRGREGPQEEVRAPEHFPSYDFPLAVLIDSRTASAAELLAGALQDHDRAVLVGLRSFGKGLVQSVFPLSEGAGLALTTAQYLAPSGRVIQRLYNNCKDYQMGPCDEDPDEPKSFRTDSGREIPGGGGIAPDRVVYPETYFFSPFQAFLKGNNAFFDFAQQHLRRHNVDVGEDFEVTPEMLDQFQLFLSERGVQVTLAEWTATLEFIRQNLKQEIVNLTFGVERGDQIELGHDPQVLAAIESLG